MERWDMGNGVGCLEMFVIGSRLVTCIIVYVHEYIHRTGNDVSRQINYTTSQLDGSLMLPQEARTQRSRSLSSLMLHLLFEKQERHPARDHLMGEE